MSNRKVFQILRHCTDEDLDQIERGLNSPFFNTNQQVYLLFKHLRKYHPIYKHQKLEKAYLEAKLFPGKENSGNNSQTILRDLFYHLKIAIEKCLVLIDLEEDRHRFKLEAVRVYERRGAYAIFEMEKKALLKALEKTPYKNTSFYLLQHHIFQLWYLSPSLHKYTPDANAIYYAQFNLEHFFVLQSLQNYCDQLLRKAALKEIPPVAVEMELKSILPLYRHIPLFDLYAATIELFLHKKEDFLTFDKMVNSYIDLAGELSILDRRNLLNLLVGYGNFQYNSGHLNYLEEIWILYQYAQKDQFLLDDGVISSITYTNIAATGARLNQFEEVSDFLSKFTKYLKNEDRSRSETLAKAYYWYYLGLSTKNNGHLDDALRKLAEVNFGSDDFALRIRSLLLRITFDNTFKFEKNIDSYNRNITNFERWLRENKKITDQKKKAYLAFNRIIRNLAKIIMSKNYEVAKVEKLKKEIIEADNLVLKAWLLDKVGNLE